MKLKSLAFFAAALLAAPVFAGPQVELKTNMGVIVVELDDKAAPKHAENFLEYAKSGHFDGTIFHRVIKGFMAQGGGFTKDMQQKATRGAIMHEGEANAKVGAKNERGTLAAARTGDPHSATSQFFINYKHNDMLDFRAPNPQAFGYTVFGKVVSGMEIVDKWADLPQGQVGPHGNVPKDPIIIEKATVKK
jgi:cyclophilin family peptidyl-prolyl cis-trans isomerase